MIDRSDLEAGGDQVVATSLENPMEVLRLPI
jgi:hypothetical protein